MAMSDELISAAVTAALGEERARELRAGGADKDWDQAIAYTLTQTSQPLGELKSPGPAMSELPLQGADTAAAAPGRT
jgi:hypothetical protein